MGKNSTIIFTVLFIALVLLGAGYILYSQKGTNNVPFNVGQNPPIQTPPTVPTTPTPEIPKDWKTYTNTKYHYSFRYPDSYKIWQLEGIGIPREISGDAKDVLVENTERTTIFEIASTIINDINNANAIKARSGSIDPSDIHLINTIIADQKAYNLEFREKGRWKRSGLYYVENLNHQVLSIGDSFDNPVANQIFSSLKFIE